jgi:probable rRNA maturation factor
MEPGSSRPFGGGLVITDRNWRRAVRDVERRVARAMAAVNCAADVVLTDDRTVKRLNAMSREKNKPTNVLTYEAPPEIILAFGVVRREAAASGRSVAAHLAHLLIHGALHLAGYDHQHVGDARRMEAAEAVLLSRLKIANPWKNR